MIKVLRSNFKKFCLDVLNSDTQLVEVAKYEGQDNLMVIYCEIVKYNELQKKYKDKNQLYRFVKTNIKEPYFHTCYYDKKKKTLKIDDGLIDEIIFV